MLPPDAESMNATAALLVKSLLIGIDSSTSANRYADPAVDIAELPFEEAVLFLKKKNVLPSDQYYKLSDKARFRAFTVSRLADADMMERVKTLLTENLESGGGLKEFLEKTDTEILDGLGLAGNGGGWYWENVYRTNVQTAYNAGRALGFEAVRPVALELVGIGDMRQTEICRSLTQPPVRKMYDDPYWKTHWPPFHFGCRTTIRAIYDPAELEEEPITVDVPEEKPAQGFGTYPITSGNWWRELASMTKRAKKYGIQKEIETAKKLLVDKVAKEVLSLENAKTTAEVETLLKNQKWFEESANSMVSLRGVDLDSAKNIFSGYEQIFEKFPELKNEFKEVTARYMGKKIYARSFLLSGKIEVNTNFYKDYKNLAKKYAHDVESKWHPQGTDARAIIVHEIGHNINGYIAKKKNINYRDVAINIKKEVLRKSGKTKDDVENELSRYAKKDSEEFFAEAFCEYITSKKPRLVAKTFGEVLKQWLK